MEKAERVEQGLGRVPEGFEDCLLRHLGSSGAIRVSTHAVHDNKQRRVLGSGSRHSVLVLLASAKEADIGVLHPQEEIRASVRLGVLYITPKQPSVVSAHGAHARSAVYTHSTRKSSIE